MIFFSLNDHETTEKSQIVKTFFGKFILVFTITSLTCEIVS
jgi:hypothetical protein